MRRFAFVLFVVFAFSNCATWVPVGGQYEDTKQAFEAELPEGWLRANPSMILPSKNPLFRGTIFTRDGVLLQQITVGFMELDTDLLNTKKTFSAQMLPQEAAEIVTDDFRLTSGFLEFNILENVPAEVAGHSGFRLLMDMKLTNNMWKRMLFYGAIVKDRFYFIHYYAPRRHYFDRDEETFMGVLETFRTVAPSQEGKASSQ